VFVVVADVTKRIAMGMKQSPESGRFECVEIYVPKKLENLSTLFTFLRDKLTRRSAGTAQELPIDGFSMYGVDGAFYGKEIYQERTIVIRILFKRSEDDDDAAVQAKVSALGSELASGVAMTEEEFWICHYPQGAVIFRAHSGSK